MTDDDLLDEQLRYYSARAAHYDDAYRRTGHSDRGPEANARWLAELARVEAVLDGLPLDGEVVELGCGTGHWTVRLAATARSVLALDGSAEMLDQARRKLSALPRHDHVTLEVVDLVRAWDPPSAQWDAAVACFFLEHVPDGDLDPLLAKVARGLRPGGVVFVAEGQHHGDVPDPVEHRHLHETSFRVVERRRTPDELTAAFARHGIEVAVETTDHLFVVATGRKA